MSGDIELHNRSIFPKSQIDYYDCDFLLQLIVNSRRSSDQIPKSETSIALGLTADCGLDDINTPALTHYPPIVPLGLLCTITALENSVVQWPTT